DVVAGVRVTGERGRAGEMRPVIDTVDLLLDLHSMQNVCPPLMLCGEHQKGKDLGMALGAPEYVVSDAGHAAGTRMRDYGPFGDSQAPQNSLLLEAGQHWEASSVPVTMDVTLRFLRHTGAIDEAFFAAHHTP
ncbi:MAG: succinylglutamate desuccinylase, partial [Magnetovibrio sp.]|nr:succinylglutamate desuccinylase [Magnetovibrio sp.]